MAIASKKPTSISLPPPLLGEVTRLAKRKRQTPSALVGAALRQYLDRGAWKKALAYGAKKAKEQGIRSERDIIRAIEEYRRTTASLSNRLGMSPAHLKKLLREEVRAHRDEDLQVVEEWAAVDAETWPSDDRDS